MNLIEAINKAVVEGFVYSKKGFRTIGERFFQGCTSHPPGKISVPYLLSLIGQLDQHSLLSEDWGIKEPEDR